MLHEHFNERNQWNIVCYDDTRQTKTKIYYFKLKNEYKISTAENLETEQDAMIFCKNAFAQTSRPVRRCPQIMKQC